jgi:Signal transduction histidine kinase
MTRARDPGPADARSGTRPRRDISSTRTGLAAIAFIIFALVALTAGPGLTGRALDTLRADTDSTSGRAQRLLDELNLLDLQGIVEHQNMRYANTPGAVTRYQAIRVQQDARIRDLIPLAQRAGPATYDHAIALQQLVGRWNEAPDARAAGKMNEREFAALMPHVVAVRDSVLTEMRELTDDFRDAASRDQVAGGVLIRRERGVALTVGGLAILAVMALVWFAWHDRRLTTELARALDEEARLRAEAEQRRRDLERVTESRTRLMRGFTHDVKNPIGAADGFLQLLQDGILDPLSEKQAHAVGRTRNLLDTALRLIADLLDVARTETGDLHVRAEPIDVTGIARALVEEYRPLAARKGLELLIEDGDNAVLAESDPLRVRQVMGNLVSNAVKYTPHGRVVVRAREHDPRRVVIEVTDSGPGIPHDKRKLLFQEFVRLDPSAAPGAGVGLAISRRIALALRGDITVASTPGAGSTFTLWLPAAATLPAPRAYAANPA